MNYYKIEEKTAGFVGREFVFQAIEEFLTSQSSGIRVNLSPEEPGNRGTKRNFRPLDKEREKN